MAKTASDIIFDTLIDWGVDVVFGLPGDGIDGHMEALRKRQDRIRFIHVRHEEAAAFMACGYAKYTGRLGVCLATSGPGGIHLLNGLYDAKLDHVPVLAITGLQFHDVLDTMTQQDVDLDKLFMHVSVYSSRIMDATHAEAVTNLACHEALARRGVAHITAPIDIQTLEVGEWARSPRNIPHHSSDIWTTGGRVPMEKDLAAAAAILNSGRKIAILAGAGAMHATAELEKAAETLGAPIVKALLGKASVPDDSPYTTGQVGLVGTKPSQEALEDCDTLLIVGSGFPYIEFYPKPGKARGIQIDIDPTRLGLRYPVEVGLIGDSKKTLAELIPRLKRKEDRSFLATAQDGMKDWWALMETRGTSKEKPMKPQVLAWELGKRLESTAIVSCDSGTAATWWARQMPVRRGQMHSISGTLATMACGLPYAIGAQVAYPDRQCIAFAGDGAFSMLMADFSTAVKYGLPIKVIVLRNNLLGMIRWEQIVLQGNPEFGVFLEPIDYAAIARACGGTGLTIEDPEKCGEVLDAALATRGPVLVDAAIDPNEPPLPPKIKPEQALKFAEALVKGEPYRGPIVMTVLKDKVRELI